MKIALFMAIWACLAFSQKTNAQQTIVQKQDTLTIQIQGKSQLHILGKSMKEIAKYERADSLKNLFVEDYNKALKNNSISSSTHRIHYLVGKDGQRRMKAAGDAYTEEPFDLELEKMRFRFNLPKIHYTIYDLKEDIQMHFYLEDSSVIDALKHFYISDAIKILSESKKDQRNNYNLGLYRDGLGLTINHRAGKRQIELAGKPILGLMLMGNDLSPVGGIDMGFTFSNKYKEPTIRISYLWSNAVMFHDQEFNVNNARTIVMNEISFSGNMPRSKRERWAGMHVGIVTGLEKYGFPKRAEKFGWHIPLGDNIIYNFDFISNKKTTWSNLFKKQTDEKVIYSMSIRAWF